MKFEADFISSRALADASRRDGAFDPHRSLSIDVSRSEKGIDVAVVVQAPAPGGKDKEDDTSAESCPDDPGA